MNKVFQSIGMLAATPIAILLAILLEGYVLSKCWIWFVSETFGVMKIGYLQAVGIALIVGAVTKQEINCKKEKRAEWIDIAIPFAKWPIILLTGWIIHLFI